MTTIACDGKSMAGDGQSQDVGGLIRSADVVKVLRAKDGRIYGLAGTPFDLDAISKWMDEGGDWPAVNPDHFELLVLEKSGEAYCYSSKGGRSKQLMPCGVGSGMDLAIGAMEAGVSALQAVEIACRRHTGSGGQIIVLHLGDAA